MDAIADRKRKPAAEAAGAKEQTIGLKERLASGSGRQQVIGNYVAPDGYYDRTKTMPFLGRINCSTSEVVAGSWQEIVLDYQVGESGLADGAWIKATFKFYSDWALFQTTDPKAANYVTAEYQAGPLLAEQEPGTVQSLNCRFDQKGHERPYQKAVIVDIVDGYLNPGDHIVIRLGDMRFGGSGTRVQTFTENDFRFRCYIDPVGTSRFAAIPGDVVIQVVPGPARSLVMTGPRLIRPGVKLPLRIRAEDEWGNACRDCGGKVQLRAALDGREVYDKTISLDAKSWAVALVTDLPADAEGELVIKASMPDNSRVEETSFFVTIDKSSPVERPFYADLHVHSEDTVGNNDTTYNLSYGRDVAGLDVLGYTANDFHIAQARWNKAVEVINTFNENARYVVFPGIEWCGNSCAGGDHNVVFLHDRVPEFPFDRDGNLVRSFEWNEDMKGGELKPGIWPIDELYAIFAKDPEGHLLIPHVGGRRTNPAWHHPALERLVEVGSAWGHFPWLLEDYIRHGYKVGASAASDEHRGRPGGGAPGAAVFGVKGGLTGVICDQLDRPTIGKALRARHTWATTGERLVALASCNGQIQGDEFKHDGNATVAYRFLGDAGWDEIAAYDHTGCFWRRNLQEEMRLSDHRIRLRWGGARIRDRYRASMWQGTVTVSNAVVHSTRARGLEHKEEAVWRIGAMQIGFRSDTYGDTDALEIDLSNLASCNLRIQGTIDGYVKVGDPLKRNPFVHCPEFDWKVSGADLVAAKRLTMPLGGADLVLDLELISDAAMPRDVSGTLELKPENGPHGFRPVYFLGRQVDDAKAYTSPLFITFI
jgi:hypothetical protein